MSSQGKDRRKARSTTRTHGGTRSGAEDVLGTAEPRYGSVVAALEEGIVFMDADGRLQASNASAERAMGTKGRVRLRQQPPLFVAVAK